MLDWLESRPASFDLITGLDIVEHFHKSEVLRFLDACHSALKPGGRLVLQTPNMDRPWGITIRYGDFTHERSDSIRTRSPGCLRSLDPAD